MVLEKTLESPLDCKEIQPVHSNQVLGVHWQDWCWSWNSNTLATWCKELTHLERPWCWERLRAGEGDNRGCWLDGITDSTWVWVDSGNWWWTGRPGVLQFMQLQRVRHDWATELNWINKFIHPFIFNSYLISLDPFSSVIQSCPTLCDPMNRSTPGLPVHHQLPEFTQTHVHRARAVTKSGYKIREKLSKCWVAGGMPGWMECREQDRLRDRSIPEFPLLSQRCVEKEPKHLSSFSFPPL